MASTTRDPWVDVRTLHGFAADQVISALQKEIRRGHTENAVLLAYEMARTSPALEDYLWQRLLVIAVEDIGFGELQAPVLVHALYQTVQTFDRSVGEHFWAPLRESPLDDDVLPFDVAVLAQPLPEGLLVRWDRGST